MKIGTIKKICDVKVVITEDSTDFIAVFEALASRLKENKEFMMAESKIIK